MVVSQERPAAVSLPDQAELKPLPLVGFEAFPETKKAEVMQLFLAQDLETLLYGYGDYRIRPDRVYKGRRETLHGSRTQPYPEELSLSASTESTPTQVMWTRGEGYLHSLRQAIQDGGLPAFRKAYLALKEAVNKRLLAIFGLPGNTGVIGCQSVTTAELVPFLFGVTHNIVLAETGVDTPSLASGKHADSVGWQGEKLDRGKTIEGLGRVEPALQLEVRDHEGKLYPPDQIEQRVRLQIERLVRADPQVKIGLRAAVVKAGEPTLETQAVSQLARDFPDNILPILDAAQMTLSETQIALAVKEGFLVYISGHKLPGGPPTSCKIFINAARVKKLQDQASLTGVPEGLRHYQTAYDYRSVGLESESLPEVPNVPQLIKWLMVLDDMEEFYGQPEENRRIVMNTASRMVQDLVATAGWFELLGGAKEMALTQKGKGKRFLEPLPEYSTTTAFYVLVNDGGEQRRLNFEELKIFYWLLNHPLDQESPLLKDLFTEEERFGSGRVNQIPVHTGYPAKVGSGETGYLRLAWRMADYNEIFRLLPGLRSLHDRILDLNASNDASLPTAREKLIEKILGRGESHLTVRAAMLKAKLLAKHWTAAKAYFQTLEQ